MNLPKEANKEGDLFNKFKIQSLEEVTEMDEESDITSHMSYNSIDIYSSDNNKSFENSPADFDTGLRIKVIDELDQISTEKLLSIFGHPSKPTVNFTYDFEDFENTRINIDLKKLVNIMDITLPIIYCKKENKYLFGTKKLSLIIKG